MKAVCFSWNEMLFAIQKTDYHVFELFCKASNVRASMHIITSLELIRHTNAVFSATKQMKRIHGHGCWKAYFSVRESCLMQF